MNEPNEAIKAAASLMQMSGAELLAVLRRDWAVRVLDAWCVGGGFYKVETTDLRHVCHVYNNPRQPPRAWYGQTQADVRHAAALAVFPTLPADVRAELGECP